jgi:hypothetical protein
MNFDDFLKKTGEKQVSFSKRTGIDNTMICKYLCNVRNPGFFDALKIKAASSGKVTEYDHESGEPVEIEATFYFVRMKKE